MTLPSMLSIFVLILLHHFYFCDVLCTLHKMYKLSDASSETDHYNLSSELELPLCDYIDVEQLKGLRPRKSDLSVLQLNIRGLLNKQGCLKDLMIECNTDVALLCETWLKKETEILVSLDNYKTYSNPRISRIGGGVAILLSKTLRSRARPDLHVKTTHLEHIVVEVKTNTENILLVSGYRPPNANYKVFIKEYMTLMRKLKKLNKHKIILGIDHNLDLLKTHLHKQTNQFLENNLELDLVPCISKPTRITRKTATLIDNIFLSQNLQHQMHPHLIIEDLSDHLPILVIIRDLSKGTTNSTSIRCRNLNPANLEKINNDIMNHDWHKLLDNANADQGFINFHRILCETIDKHAPEQNKRINPKKIIRDPWITSGIMKSLNKQRQMFKSQIKGDVSTFNYKNYRNNLQKIIRYSRNKYLHEKCTEYRRDSRKLWRLINDMIRKTKNKQTMIEGLKIKNLMRYDPDTITNEFCEFFSTVGERFSGDIKTPENNTEYYLDRMTRNNSTLFLTPTNLEEVKDLITSLPNKTSSGHDSISNNLLKKLSPSITEPLTIVFNKSLESGMFPEEMKKADVVPLHKSKAEHECTNYRPISLLLTISKLLEKLMYKRTYYFLEQTDQLYHSQYGFRKSHSCETAIMELVSSIIKGKDDGFYTLALFIDLSKAFDTVDHKILLDKLDKHGIRGVAKEWFRSYLTNRQMRVKCGVSRTGKYEHSKYQPLSHGAPQGSCLGPLIFLIFTNDLHKQIENSSTILFADDTTLYKTHRNLNYLRWCLEDDMTRLSDWFRANKLSMNLGKTVCVLFHKDSSCKPITIKVDGTEVHSVQEVKFLGMWLDSQLNWSRHIEKLTIKLSRNSNLIKYNKNTMPRSTKLLIYHAHITSHIQYGLTLWGNSASLAQTHRIQRIMDRCKHFITHRQTEQEKLLPLNLLTLSSMITLANYKFGYKLIHNMLPSKTTAICVHDNKNKSLLPTHQYNTRHRLLPNLAKTTSSHYLNSFLCKGPRSILTLNVETVNKPNIVAFTNSCKKLLLNKTSN